MDNNLDDMNKIRLELNDHHNEIGSLKHRMDKAEMVIEEIRELNTTTQLIAQRQNNIDEKLGELSDTVKELDKKPKENWNKFVWIIITGIASAIVSSIASYFVLTPH